MKKNTYIALFIAILLIFAVGYGINEMNRKKMEEKTALPELTNGLLQEDIRSEGVNYAIPAQYIADYGVEVPVVTNPEYLTVAESDELIADGLPGVSVEVNDEYYFYPYQIMNWHQVVQTTIDGVELTVTHDPLCYSGQVYEGATLDHSNKVYNNNALLTSAEGDFVEQATGTVVSGSDTRSKLALHAFDVVLWSDWKNAHPSGKVLAPASDEPRDYTRHPFGAYDDNDIIYFPFASELGDLPLKWLVDSFTVNGETIGFIKDIEEGFGVYNFELGDVSYVSFFDFEKEISNVYKVTDDLEFSYDFEENEISDQNGTIWSADGEALSGESEGVQLEKLQTERSYYMCWSSQHTEAELAHSENIETPNEGIDLELEG